MPRRMRARRGKGKSASLNSVRGVMLTCEESPDGYHHYSPDLEYDPSGETVNCEYCGEPRTEALP